MNNSQSLQKNTGSLPKEVYYYGSPQKLPAVHSFMAGPLRVQYEAGTLRYIKLGPDEVVRMICVAVRDENWSTIPFQIRNEHIEQHERSFTVSYEAVCNFRHIQFVWQSRIIGREDGAIHFQMEGKALSAFKKNRIGICVMHPVKECAGKACTITDPQGKHSTGAFPEFISPHQPFRNIKEMEWPLADGTKARLRFTGDVFETEDHRNWADASFKTYSTPLDLPIPVAVEPGFQVQQKVHLQLNETPENVKEDRQTLQLALPEEQKLSFKMPAIGVSRSSRPTPLSETEIALLKNVNFAHYRADVRFYRPDWEEKLATALGEAQALQLPLELALFFEENEESFLYKLVEECAQQGASVNSVLLFHRQHNNTPEFLIKAAGSFLRNSFPNIKIGGGTDAFFAELNRERVPADGLDFISYSINPQVHAFDNKSLTENLASQGETIKSAQQFTSGLAIHVSPVTLKNRYSPGSEKDEKLQPDELPYPADVRQMSLYGAGWTLGSIKYLAEAGTKSVTYFETVGLRGIIQGNEPPNFPHIFKTEAGDVFPIYHLLRKLLEWPHADILPVQNSAPLLFTSLVQKKEQEHRVFIANHTNQEHTISLSGLNGLCRIKILDERNVAEAMKFTGDFFGNGQEEVSAGEDSYSVRLLPYSIAFIQTKLNTKFNG